MPTLADIIHNGHRVAAFRSSARIVVDEQSWLAAASILAEGQASLLGLWADAEAVHMALFDEQTHGPIVITIGCPGGQFPSIGRVHAPAIRLERSIRDLFGFVPLGLPDERPWLDHGHWDVTAPLGPSGPARRVTEPAAYAFLAAEGEGVHQIPVGPVHAGIIEPGHFRFNAAGEAVVRLEERLGHTHKGIEFLMAGATLDKAARLAGRASGDSTVAYAFAFARAVEKIFGIDIPLRAIYLRALMAEFERLANHLGDIGAICNDAAFALMLAHCGVLRERVLRTADKIFGHRLMMDCIVPGGVAMGPASTILADTRLLLATIRGAFPHLAELYDVTASLQDRTVGTGIVDPALARLFGAGGYIGRASGRDFDARRALPYAPYDTLSFKVPVLDEGDVNARIWVRIREVEQSLSLIEQILDRLPADGPLHTELGGIGEKREGLALVEGFRGDVLVFVRLDEQGRIERCHLRDPSWFQWPLLEAAIKGNIVADFPLCNKSFNCSYSGHDL